LASAAEKNDHPATIGAHDGAFAIFTLIVINTNTSGLAGSDDSTPTKKGDRNHLNCNEEDIGGFSIMTELFLRNRDQKGRLVMRSGSHGR
jgi:hypothetical protein